MLLYFLADTDTLPRRGGELPGLGHHFDADDAVVARQVPGFESGGEKRAGIVVARAKTIPERRVGYYPTTQRWRRMTGKGLAASGRLWVGRDLELSSPGILARPDPLPGHRVELGDGREWIVPIARQFLEADGVTAPCSVVPRAMTLDESGEWVQGDVVDRWRTLWTIGEFWAEAMGTLARKAAKGSAAQGYNYAELADRAVEALGSSYRIGRDEAALLGLITQETAVEILHAVIDMPGLRQLTEKTASAGDPLAEAGSPADPSSGDGATGASPDTRQPSPTSSSRR